MSDGPLQFTLRRMQAVLFAPRFWGVMLTVAVVLGVAGPFGTFDRLPLAPRIAYWLAVALATFITGYAAIGLVFSFMLGSRGPRPLRLAIAGLAAGLPVTAVVVGLNTVLFDDTVQANGDLLVLFIECSLIAAAISFLFGLVDGGDVPASTPAGLSSAPPRPRILDRLPPQARGSLSHLSVQDHYVDVRTARGGTLVLMRLADAIAETDGVAGLQIHRSHWVARDAVEKAVRRDGRLYLKMTGGPELPVSRSYLPAVRAAGLAAR